jgi:cytochrome d ubiquinol oxidase subunit I
VLTEVGRQPWIVQGLLKTSNANSPNVTTTWLGISLVVFIGLYLALLVVDIWLMRRYAGLDPATPDQRPPPDAQPVPSF